MSSGPYAWTPSAEGHEIARADGLPIPYKVKSAADARSDPKAAGIQGSLASASTSLVVRDDAHDLAGPQVKMPDPLSETDRVVSALLQRVRGEYEAKAKDLVSQACWSRCPVSFHPRGPIFAALERRQGILQSPAKQEVVQLAQAFKRNFGSALLRWRRLRSWESVAAAVFCGP